MIIHTGLRTDIPAFYSEWFLNRLRAGEVCVRNPYNTMSVTKYSLSPSVVDLICFCTKNPSPLLSDTAVALLEPYGQLWFVTITPYGKLYEPNVPDKAEVMDSFRQLSKIVGSKRISWRYDPVFLCGKYTVEQHKKSFEKICRGLSGYTNECIVSFIDLYPKVKKNFPEISEVPFEIQLELADFFVRVGERFGIKIKSCGESAELSKVGVDVSGCMTKIVYEHAVGDSMHFPERRQNRKECDCFLGCDIGVYNSCAHFCRYCYANYSRSAVLENMKNHDPNSPFLIGNFKFGDKIHEPLQKSWKTFQKNLFE